MVMTLDRGLMHRTDHPKVSSIGSGTLYALANVSDRGAFNRAFSHNNRFWAFLFDDPRGESGVAIGLNQLAEIIRDGLALW